MIPTTPTIVTFRDTLRRRSPTWLQHGVAEKILYAMGVQIDALADALVASIKIRFPGYYSDETLPLIGRERRIRRGRFESDATYAARLNRWLTDHRRRGGPYALLAQLYAHYAPNNFPITLIYRSGRRFRMDIAGNVIRDDVDFDTSGATLHDDVEPERWARWWLIYDWPEALPDPGTWSEPNTPWNDPTTLWNYVIGPDEIEDLRLTPREWNAAHAVGRVVLVSALSPGRRLEIAV